MDKTGYRLSEGPQLIGSTAETEHLPYECRLSMGCTRLPDPKFAALPGYVEMERELGSCQVRVRQDGPFMPQHRPLLALTLGDPAGIGPEVCLKAVVEPEVDALARCVLIGPAAVACATAAALAIGREVVEIP